MVKEIYSTLSTDSRPLMKRSVEPKALLVHCIGLPQHPRVRDIEHSVER